MRLTIKVVGADLRSSLNRFLTRDPPELKEYIVGALICFKKGFYELLLSLALILYPVRSP